jgi:predicted unusual protein kinase regulating ubiquinone biosynthesis (AarF/ABC1/UbiB family)
MLRSRYRRILWFFAGVLLQIIWWDMILFRLGLRGLVRRTRPARLRKVAADFRKLAIQMGGVMIKVGQFLSARLDVLPREVTDELAGLQDEVRPESFEDIRRVAEQELQGPLSEQFAEFIRQPVASASIGQVHGARLRPGEMVKASPEGENLPAGESLPAQVVVKIQRPGIQEIVDVDLAALRVVGGWVQYYRPIRKRVSVPALLEEFSRSLYEEMDYLAEGKNAETFAANFEGYPGVCVPRVIWSRTARRVLTLEDVTAIKITDYAAIDAAGIDRAEVAARLFDTYLKQIFEDHFFHADPHPGNLFVEADKRDPQTGKMSWKLIFVDFGMVGRVPTNMMAGLREMLIAIGTRDGARVVEAYRTLGVLLPGTDTDLLTRMSSRVFERFWGKSTSELAGLSHHEAVEFVREFEGLLTEMPFQAPENMVLLVRCLGILSGICTGLNPDFNVWTSIAPYARKLVEAESGGGLGTIVKELGANLRPLLTLPRKTETLLELLEQGRLEVRNPDLRNPLYQINRGLRGLTAAVVFAALVFAAVQLGLAGQVTWSRVLGGAAVLALVGVMRK